MTGIVTLVENMDSQCLMQTGFGVCCHVLSMLVEALGYLVYDDEGWRLKIKRRFMQWAPHTFRCALVVTRWDLSG